MAVGMMAMGPGGGLVGFEIVHCWETLCIVRFWFIFYWLLIALYNLYSHCLICPADLKAQIWYLSSLVNGVMD